jgi:hypothetical protein
MDDTGTPENNDRALRSRPLRSRRNFLKTSAALAAAGAMSWADKVQAADDEAPEVKPRFTLPAGNETAFRVAPVADAAGFVRWGVNKPVGAAEGTQIILAGEALDPANSVLGARMVDEKHILPAPEGEADAKPYIMLGATKVPDVEKGSAMVSFILKPGENIQMLNMSGTVVVSEKDGVLEGPARLKDAMQRVAYNNTTDELQQVVLIIPPEEHAMAIGRPARAADISLIRYGMEQYMKAKKPQDKTAIFEQLDNAIWNMFANMIKDAGYDTPPEKLRDYYKMLVTPNPEARSSTEKANDVKAKKERLQKIYDDILAKRNTQPDGTQFIYSKDELESMFSRDIAASNKKPMMLDFLERIVPAQEKLEAKNR